MSGPCTRCGHDPSAIVVASWCFVIEGVEVASLNAHTVNVGHARHAYRRHRDHWHWAIRAERLRLAIPAATRLRRVTLVRLMGKGQREFDPENLSGGLKPMVDGLVAEKLIVGDRRDQAQISYDQRRASKPGLMVVIEELE